MESSSLKLLTAAGIATVGLAIIVLTGVAVLTGFKDAGYGAGVNNSTADLFIAGLTIFGTFMAIIVLALVGKVIVGMFAKK